MNIIIPTNLLNSHIFRMQSDMLCVKMNSNLRDLIDKEGFESNRSSSEVIRTILRNHYYRKYPEANIEGV